MGDKWTPGEAEITRAFNAIASTTFAEHELPITDPYVIEKLRGTAKVALESSSLPALVEAARPIVERWRKDKADGLCPWITKEEADALAAALAEADG